MLKPIAAIVSAPRLEPLEIYTEDYLEGPFSVHSEQRCSSCAQLTATVVRTAQGHLTYEACSMCGLDMDYPSPERVIN